MQLTNEIFTNKIFIRRKIFKRNIFENFSKINLFNYQISSRGGDYVLKLIYKKYNKKFNNMIYN